MWSLVPEIPVWRQFSLKKQLLLGRLLPRAITEFWSKRECSGGPAVCPVAGAQHRAGQDLGARALGWGGMPWGMTGCDPVAPRPVWIFWKEEGVPCVPSQPTALSGLLLMWPSNPAHTCPERTPGGPPEKAEHPQNLRRGRVFQRRVSGWGPMDRALCTFQRDPENMGPPEQNSV